LLYKPAGFSREGFTQRCLTGVMMLQTKAAKITALAILAAAQTIWAQSDPGPRGGPPNAGNPLPGLTAGELAYFTEGAARFREVDSVTGTQPGATGTGLGPRFNLNSCAGCHAQPAVGGSSPSPTSRQAPQVNPQIAMATNFGAMNSIPSFIQPNGPVRAVRFVRNPDGTPDGGVHDLFTITGRSDASGCDIAQPDFATAVAQQNAIFRTPISVFGDGLIEIIPESTILANLSANASQKQQLGIGGIVNRNANDGTITRFGWKAQNKSLLMFAGEAYNVEQGVTNDLFPNERDETPGCVFNGIAEDHFDRTATSPTAALSDIIGFAEFMRDLAPPVPAPGPPNPSVAQGGQVFGQIGCALCHTPVLQTGLSQSAAMTNKPVQLFSDLALHNMGPGLADGITQGLALGGDWRTAPLWGLGQKIFLLHDGRTTDLVDAIQQHASPGSEATGTVQNYNALPPQAKQSLLNFLRSL
jgi:CxxC motif-containing protein (DUF1111 family)